jgi:hypothetical protein
VPEDRVTVYRATIRSPSMFDVKTQKLIKTIEVPEGFSADGIYCDTSNDHVYIGSIRRNRCLVVDAKGWSGASGTSISAASRSRALAMERAPCIRSFRTGPAPSR